MKLSRSDAKRCFELIAAMDDRTKWQLSGFAEWHLARYRLWSTTGCDLVQDALLAVLSGLQAGPHGRHPRPDDLADSRSFEKYMRGVLRSLVEAEVRKQMRLPPHEPLNAEVHDGNECQPRLGQTAVSPADEVSFSDFKDQFFRRLRIRCPVCLLPLVEHWEAAFFSDRIPLNGSHRRHRAKLRALAKRTVRELGVLSC